MSIGKTKWFVVLFFAHALCQHTLLAVTNGAPSVLLYSPSVTVNSLEAFAREDSGCAWISWRTTTELGVNAFRIVRYRNDATPEPVGTGDIQAKMNEEGGSYELADPSAKVGESLRYKLIMVASSGAEQPVAEWAGVINLKALSPMPLPSPSAEASLAPGPVVLEKSWIGTEQRVRTWTDSLPADRVRLSLRDEGIYRVSAQELATASGWTEATVLSALASTNLALSSQGNSIAWQTDGTNLFFYGIPPVSRFAPENVYWITPGLGSTMTTLTRTPSEPVTTNLCFTDHITRQGTNDLSRVSRSSLADAPTPYVAFTYLLSEQNWSINEALIDCVSNNWTGTVTVNLLSWYEINTDDHAAGVSIGGTPVGETQWAGEQYVSLTSSFSSANLTNSVATLNIKNVKTNATISANATFFVMSYDFAYPRLYHAQNEFLRCTGGADNTVAVSGFASNDVKVLDVTITNAPVVIEPITLTYDSMTSQWTAAFACGGSGQVYQVYSTSAGVRLPSVRGVRDIDWSSATNAAEYVILIPPEGWRDGFRQALQPLADYRNAQGLKTTIVDVEAIYNAFSDGLVDPHAIQTFCSTLYPLGLKYLLLAGAGSIDYKHQALSVTSYTACLIPTLIASQTFPASGEGMTAALDGALGDINHDNLPEVAVGRLPTTQTNEVAIVVQKTIAYESDRRWKEQASIVADWSNLYNPDPSLNKYYPFSTGTDKLVTPLGKNGRAVSKHYILSETGVANGFDIFYNSLRPTFQSGASLFHFFGHANERYLGGATDSNYRLLFNEDITNPDYSWQKPTIAVIIGCRPNRWHSLTPTTTLCVLPYGLFAPNGGFAGGLGATGYMLGDEGEELAVNLYSGNGGVQGRRRLGDLWLHGLQHNKTAVNKMPPERLLCYSLIGDPTLMFDLDRRTLIMFH
jgi:hypothetical protein